jgi:DNA recombination protein RmuC
MQTPHFIALAVGLVLGGALGYLIALVVGRSRADDQLRQIAALEAKDQERERGLEEQRRLMQEAAAAQLADRDKALDEQRRLLAEAEARLKESFEALSARALGRASDEFLKTAKLTFDRAQEEAKGDLGLKQQAIEAMLRPFEECMKNLERQCQEMEGKRLAAQELMTDQVNRLMAEAGQLSNALRRPNTRGSWGEITLRTVAENAGLIEGQDYELQHSTDGEDGKLRADMVVRLPNRRVIVIDSKTPLDHYREAMNTTDEAARTALLKHHARLVRNHVRGLSSKAYWQQYEGADYVLMFLPTESMYQAALEHDPALLMDAIDSRVFLANPMTLIGVLRAVAYVLDQERLNQNALEVSDLGRKLYESIRVYGAHVTRLGRHLRQTVDAYNDSVGSLERNVLSKARQLRAKGGDQLPGTVSVDTLPGSFRSAELVLEEESDVALAEA